LLFLKKKIKSNILRQDLFFQNNMEDILAYQSDAVEDPYEGYKVVSRLPTYDCPDMVRFEVPEHPLGLSLKDSKLKAKFTIPSNYVPDNDVLAKAIQKFDLIIQNTKLFASFDPAEYATYSHINCKLNKSIFAQEVEMFYEGRYDSYDVDGDELDKYELKLSGEKAVDNRQKYAKRIWKTSPEKMEGFDKDANSLDIEYDELFHQYEVRAPIMHGLARQPRLIPSKIKVAIELVMNKQSYPLMRHSRFTLCRANEKKIRDLEYPYPDDVQLIEVSDVHKSFRECDCNEKLATKEYTRVIENFVKGQKKLDTVDEVIAETSFRSHTYYKKVVKTVIVAQQTGVSMDNRIIYFAREKNLDPEKNFSPDDFQLESVFKKASCKDEIPLSGSSKNNIYIPFYYPKFLRKTLDPGKEVYNEELCTGPSPRMVILSGMPYTQINQPTFNKCMTRTSMTDPKFTIKELTIFKDGDNAYQTPYNSPVQHYLHFLKQKNENWNEAANRLEGGEDFFTYRDQHWMFPIAFDDAVGTNGTIKAKIQFEEPLTEKYDVTIMRIPYHELHINRETKGTQHMRCV
jgi:hypothetical protein